MGGRCPRSLAGVTDQPRGGDPLHEDDFTRRRQDAPPACRHRIIPAEDPRSSEHGAHRLPKDYIMPRPFRQSENHSRCSNRRSRREEGPPARVRCLRRSSLPTARARSTPTRFRLPTPTPSPIHAGNHERKSSCVWGALPPWERHRRRARARVIASKWDPPRSSSNALAAATRRRAHTPAVLRSGFRAPRCRGRRSGPGA